MSLQTRYYSALHVISHARTRHQEKLYLYTEYMYKGDGKNTCTFSSSKSEEEEQSYRPNS